MIIDKNSPQLDPNVYSGYAAITTQPYTEINSKNGTQYEAQINLGNIATGATKGFSFYSGDDPVLVKFRQITGDYEDITYTIYRDSVVSGGTPVEYGNLSSRNPVDGSVVILNQPTVGDTGTLDTQPKDILGSGVNKVITYGEPQGERVLSENTTYYVTVTNNSGSNAIPKLLIDLGWYQGPIDTEIRVTDENCPT